MDKASLINRYAKTPEQRVMFAHILDLALRSENRNTVESGNFLPESDADTVSDMLRSAGIRNYILFGGCDGAERKCPVFLPDYLTENDITDSPTLAGIAFATAEVNRFDLDRADFTHRDCLGALMGLGIERETVGDIVCSGGKAVIVLKTGVAELVKNELDSIGRFRVTVSVGDTAVMERHDDSVELSDTVASMRLDAVCCIGFQTVTRRGGGGCRTRTCRRERKRGVKARCAGHRRRQNLAERQGQSSHRQNRRNIEKRPHPV